MQLKTIRNVSVLFIVLALEIFFYFLPHEYLADGPRAVIINLFAVAFGLELSLVLKETTV